MSSKKDLIEALEATEWHREDGHGPPECTVCGGYGDLREGPKAGHTADCVVGRALGRTPGEGHPDCIARVDAQAEYLANLKP